MVRLRKAPRENLAIFMILIVALSASASGCSKPESQAAPPASRPADAGPPPAAPAEKVPEKPEQQSKTPGANVFDAKQTKVGDEIMGMKVTKISVIDVDQNHYLARVQFSGEATVTGTYTHHKKGEEMLGCKIRFEVDEQSAANLPREKTDARVTWFVFSNHDEAEKLLGPPGAEGRATIAIDEYGINKTNSCEYNVARLVRASVEK